MAYVLVGNYGVGNFGDEALRQYFIDEFQQAKWRVLSAQPKAGEYHRLPGGLRSFFTTNWLKTVGVINKSKGIVFGGGSLFSDAESPYACLLWWWHAFIAWFLGKRIILAYQGVGPLNSWTAKLLTRWVLRRARLVTVRDPESFKRVKQLAPKAKVIESFDPVFGEFVKNSNTVAQSGVCLVIPRANSGPELEAAVKAVNPKKFIIASLQPRSPEEQQICTRLKTQTGASEVIDVLSTKDLMGYAVSQAATMITDRYHAALAALAAGIPCEVIPQRPGDKLDSLKEWCKNPNPAQKEALLVRLKDGENALRKAL